MEQYYTVKTLDRTTLNRKMQDNRRPQSPYTYHITTYDIDTRVPNPPAPHAHTHTHQLASLTQTPAALPQPTRPPTFRPPTHLPPSNPTPKNLPTPLPNLHRIPLLQHHQRPTKRLLSIPPPLHKLPPQRRQTRTPPHRQSSPELLLHLAHLLHQLPTALALALGNGVHGRGEEEPDGFVDVRFGCDVRKADFGEGFGDADYGFELAHGYGD